MYSDVHVQSETKAVMKKERTSGNGKFPKVGRINGLSLFVTCRQLVPKTLRQESISDGLG